MNKTTAYKRIFFILLCLAMMTAIFPSSAFAAKDKFQTYRIDDVTITGIDAPTAGKTFDFTAEESSQKYNIIKVAWSEQNGSNYITGTSSSASAGKRYTVYVVLEVATADHYFLTDAARKPAVPSVTVNGNPANASNTQDYNLFSIDASKYAHDSTYQKYLVVMYTFPTVEAPPISSIEFGIPAPVPGERVPTTWQTSGITINRINGSANNGQINVNSFVWSLQDGTPLAGNEVFEYGKKYTLRLTLGTVYGASFATDANHLLAQPGKPFPTVTVKMNGKDATVLPTYDSYSNLLVVASCVFDCDSAAQIKKIDLTGIDAPTAGSAPDFTFIGGAGYENNGRNDAYYKNGVCWSVADGSYLANSGQAFAPNTRYQVDIRLKPQFGYEFATKSNGNIDLTATVNGNPATVSGNKNEILITYVFPETKTLAFSTAGVTDIDAPVTGQLPDYTVSYSNINYGPAKYNDSTTQNGVSWYNETDKKTVRTGEKFEAGKAYSVSVTIWSNDGYTFQYKSGAVDVAGTVNGQKAAVSSRSDVEVTLTYTFPKTEAHKCSPLKVDEHKATCKEEGRKAHYFCPECGKFFEDSKCTKEIANINAWGVIPKLEHTGGKATCENRAACKNCGEYYGEFAAHSYGSAWDYKDATGHAHTCKVCGAHDAVQPHGGGTAACGKVARCAECKEEYGEVMQHQWSSAWTYTDSKGHAHKCTVCGDHDTVQDHTGGTADCQNKAKCSACGTEYGKNGEHTYGTAWEYTSASGHAHICTVKGCQEHDTIVKHTPGPAATETSSQTCTVCKYVIAAAKQHEHKLTKVNKIDETCTTAGRQQHYVCDGCGKLFSDAKGSKEITDPSTLTVPAPGHKESSWKSDEDTHWKECTVKGCGAIIDTSKQSHEFDKNKKCVICRYRHEVGTVEVTSPSQTETAETANPAETDNNAPVDSGTTAAAPDTTTAPGSSSAPPSSDNTVLWIIVAVSVSLAAGCMIVMTVVLVKKNKKA